MLEHDFNNSLGHSVCVTARMVERAMNAELEPEGITFRQFQVLAWLAIDGGLSQVDLADRMNIEPATLVSVLDRMERDGWIERTACSDDRRRKIIRPIAKAKPVWEKIVSCARRIRARSTQGLSDAQQQTLRDLLAVVQSNLTKLDRPQDAVQRERASVPTIG